MKKILVYLLVVVQVICMLPMSTMVHAATPDVLASAAETVELYVKPDAEAGGDGSEAQPFATLQQAADKIAAIVAEDADATIHVNLMDGKHVLQQTLTLGDAHSSSAKVVFKNAEGANPIITSGREIDSSKFALVAGTNYYAYQLTDADKIDGAYPDFRELQVNGKSAILARSEDYTFTEALKDDTYFRISNDHLNGITTENVEGTQLMITSEYQVYGLHIQSIQQDLTALVKGVKNVYITEADWTAYTDRVRVKRGFIGRSYYLQNHIALLDEPGEFYYDQSAGKIYYYPYADETLSDCTVEYAPLERLIYMEDAQNYVFDGLTFTGTSNVRFNHQAMLYGNGAYPSYYYDEGPEEIAGAICGTDTTDLTVQNCTFTELDTGAIMFEYGVKNFNITGNTFRELGICAIALGAKQLVWNSNNKQGGVENVTIRNNYVDHIGLEVLCSTGIRVAKARNTKVLNNTVKNVPYSGIGMGMGFTLEQPDDNFINLYKVEIAYNHVENFMYNGNDGGAIYICGANAAVAYKTTDRVSIHDNYIKANGYDQTAVGIYHDGSASNVHTYNNVIVDVASTSHGVIFTQSLVENQLAHNILIENNYTTIQAPTCDLGEEYNIVLKNNRVFGDSSKLPTEALAIIQAAGIKIGSEYVIKPVQLELSKLDNSVHYAITPSDTEDSNLKTVATFKLTNNDTVARNLQLIVEGLPEGITCTIGGNGALVQPGESANVTVTFTADPNTFAPSETKAMLNLSVVEECGRTMNYPKAISMATLSQQGTAENPYLIYTADDLKAITTQGLDKHYKVMADIDLSGIANWTPIGTSSTKFTGTFDGNGHTISNMKVTGVNGQCLGGLFGWIEYPAVVKNLTIENANINVNHDFAYTSFGGVVAAYNMGGTIDNCQVSGALSVTNKQAKEVSLGGIVGISKTNGADKTATIVNCISDVDITLTCPAGGATYIGGIVAKVDAADNAAYKAIVANCGYLGDITVNSALTANTYVAGIVGWMESNNNASATKSELHNCYNAGSITGLSHVAYSVNTGAIYGRLRYTTVSNVYAMSGVATAHPGVDIQNKASVKGMSSIEMKLNAFVGTLADAVDALNSGILASSSVKAMYWAPVEGGYPVQSAEKYVSAGDSDGSQEAPYLIYDVDDLKAIFVHGLDKHYKLMADIDLSGIANWTPIGATGTRFTGTFDGNGYTISNMKVTSVNGQCLGGLFGWIEYPAVVKNLTLGSASVSVNHDFAYTSFGGLLVAYNMGGTIDNCKVSGALSVTNAQAKEVSLGGIVGISKTNGADKTATIVNCISDVDITLTCPAGGATYIGGIAAKVDAADNAAYQAIVANCGYLGDITVDSALTANTYVAGIVGWMESNNNASATKSQLHNCYSAGSITGLTHAAYTVNTGAIYGRLRYTTVSDVYALTDVATAHPGVDIQGAAFVAGMVADEMKTEGFVLTLADAAEALNSGILASGSVKAMYWTPVEGGYPVQSTEKYVPTSVPNGSQEAPYLIYDADDLKAISTLGLDKHYKLMADIDLSGIANWTPIAATGTRFTGTFDGNDHTISNMKVTGVNGQCLGGLFGWIEYPAVVKNLTIENANINVNHDFAYTSFGGVVVAYNMGGTIDNCKVSGDLSVTNAQAKEVSLGGIVGISKTNGADKTATIVNCISDVDITLTCPAGGATYIGGIVAKVDAADNAAYKAIVANCGYLGDITVNSALTANTYVAGIVGWMESNNNASATKSQLQNCYSAGTITGLSHVAYSVNTGAIYGRLRYTTVSDVYALSDVATAHPGVDIQGKASVKGMTADKMKSEAFVVALADAAEALNGSVLAGSEAKAMYWTISGNGYPVHSDYHYVAYAIVDGKVYESVQDAVDAANGAVVTLLRDAQESVTASGDLYLDLNGHSLQKLTIDGTLYGMDSATDQYVASGAKIETVDGTYAARYQTADAKRYMAITEGEGVSFHRFYLGITYVSLAPKVTGFGYKAEFYGDEAVQAQISNIGYKLSLGENNPITRTAEFKNLLTLRLRNYDVENYGETEVNASVFITLNNGETIESATYSYSMRDMVGIVAANFDSYTLTQKQSVKEMCKAYPTMASWEEIANILNWTEEA